MARPASMPASSPCSATATRSSALIAGMAAQEQEHLRHFDASARRARRPPDPAPAVLGGRRPRAGRGHGADQPGRRHGLHRRDRGRDRRPLFRAARRARRQRPAAFGEHRAASRPTSAPIATPRSRPAPNRASAIPYCTRRSERAAVPPSNCRRGSEPMRLALLALAAVAAILPASAQQPGVAVPGRKAPAAEPRVNQVIVYGNDPCPASTDPDEITVCARLPEDDRYRIPPNLRDNPNAPANQAWANRAYRACLCRPHRHRQLLDRRRRRLHRLPRADHQPGPRRAPRRRRRQLDADGRGSAPGPRSAAARRHPGRGRGRAQYGAARTRPRA